MQFPLSFWDISLWLALTAIILLITSEMLSSRYGKIIILIDKKKLKNAAFVVSSLFLATVAMRIINIISIP
jgi:hypothetical protein